METTMAVVLRQLLTEATLLGAKVRLYWMDHLLGLFVDFIYFYAILVGIRVAVPGAEIRLDAVLLMYGVMQLVLGLLLLMPQDLMGEALRGTLEHLALARGGLLRLLFLRAGVNMLFILVRTTFLFAVLLLVTGVQLQPNPWWALCLPPLLLAGLGLALFLGGLTLIFRQVGNAVSFLQFLLIPYFLSLANWQPYMAYLPIAPAAQAANLALTRKTLDQGLLLLGLVQGVLLFLLGFFLLLWIYTLVRRRGIFGRF